MARAFLVVSVFTRFPGAEATTQTLSARSLFSCKGRGGIVNLVAPE